MNTNIPLYRAKKIDNDECVVGYFDPTLLGGVIHTSDGRHFIINPSTLSIHFPDMLANDSNRLFPSGEKDLRIFASLSEDGKGGDLLEILDCESADYVAVYNKSMFSYGAKNVNPAEDEWYFETFYELDECLKIIGIKQ